MVSDRRKGRGPGERQCQKRRGHRGAELLAERKARRVRMPDRPHEHVGDRIADGGCHHRQRARAADAAIGQRRGPDEDAHSDEADQHAAEATRRQLFLGKAEMRQQRDDQRRGGLDHRRRGGRDLRQGEGQEHVGQPAVERAQKEPCGAALSGSAEWPVATA